MKIDINNTRQYSLHMEAITGEDIKSAVVRNHADLYKMLRRLEKRAHAITTRQCNGVSEEQEAKDDKTLERIVKKVEELLPLLAGKVFVNYDARGYALKVRDVQLIHSGMCSDWGGYGIVAPEF